ncbi:MAG TPA: hypothetical protein VEB70_08290 [Noviherbaspirillum sp.]|nr:hypothetical protein [Noviherbaspirillum sp.]
MSIKRPIRRFAQLLEHAEIGKFPVDCNGKNILHHLCDNEKPDIEWIKECVRAGCNFVEPNLKDSGFTPFAYAVALQHRTVIDLFLNELIAKHNRAGLPYVFTTLYEKIELPIAPKTASFERLCAAQSVVDALMHAAVEGTKQPGVLPTELIIPD